MPDARALRARLKSEVTRLSPAIASVSRELHRHPELSLEEKRSAGLLARFLASEGFRIRRGVAGLPTAFVARKRSRRGGPRIALLAEYDALPGIGHACGHNLIGAAAVGAGAALGRVLGDLQGEVVVIGTPAEETIGGKAVMAGRGVFRGVDAALMFHPSTENRVYTTSLACHSLEVIFHGRAAHAVSAPEKGINALEALIRLFNDLKRLRRRLPPEVRMPGVIIEGGRRANIVPDRAVGRFSLRARDLATLGRVEKAFRAAARAAARATGARLAIRSVDYPYAEMVTNRALAAIFKRELRRMGRRTVDAPRTRMGSLDMGNVSHRVPSIHPYVAIAPPGVALHSRAFARLAGGPRGRAGLLVAARALALSALEVMLDDGTLRRARREFFEFRRRRRGRAPW
ncbi:MAG: amidohydrolase [Acidobacteria bacterium]|nr:amidohydrolase [Acidobacteriota bacterium]